MKPRPNRSSKAVWPLLLGLVATISLAVVLSQASKPAGPTPSGSAIESPSAQVTPASSAVATEVAVPTPSVTYGPPPTDTDVPTPDERITQTYIVATLLTAERAAGATGDYIGTKLAATPSEVIPTGIFDGGWDVFRYPSEDVVIQNMWTGELANHSYGASVWAGSLHSDPTQGLVLVMIEGPVFTYLSPVKAGSLHIVAEQNLRLTLLSTNGTTFYFDVPGQTFVDSLTQVVPTATPYQAPTPTPTRTPPPAVPVVTCTPGPTPLVVTAEPDCIAY
jgi:hypothetical protein